MNRLRLSTLVSAIAFASVILYAGSSRGADQALQLTPAMQAQVLNLAQKNPAGLQALVAKNPKLATAIAVFATQCAPNSAVAVAQAVSAGAPPALAAEIAAAVALVAPDSAADVAAAVAGAHPAQAAGIAAEVTLAVPGSAVRIAQRVVQTVPGQALAVAAAMAQVATTPEQTLLIAKAIAQTATNTPAAQIAAAMATEDCKPSVDGRVRGGCASPASLASAVGVTLTAVQQAATSTQVQNARTEGAAQAQTATTQIGAAQQQVLVAAGPIGIGQQGQAQQLVPPPRPNTCTGSGC